MKQKQKALLQLHLAVVLFGFTAILGELISLSSLPLTLYRVVLTSLVFFLWPGIWPKVKSLSKETVLRFAFIGMIVALHWLTFYASIKNSNASTTLICLATTSFMTSFIEPLLLRKRLVWIQVAVGLFIIPAMALVIQGSGEGRLWGIVLGLTSAFLAAIFPTLNKKWMGNQDVIALSTIQISSAAIFLAMVAMGVMASGYELSFVGQKMDIVYMLLLAFVCTNIAFVLSIQALKYISAFQSTLAVNLEPIYGILLAIVLLNQYEEMNTSFILGGLLVLTAVIGYPILMNRLKKEE